MARSESIINKLAWRAKWRRRWATWKKTILILTILIVGVPACLLFTPWLPGQAFKYIETNKIDPLTETLNPWAVRRMYQLGMFYGLTMRENPDGNNCYMRIIKWRLGYNLRKALLGAEQDVTEPLEFPDEVDEYVGFAVIQYARYNRLHQHEQWAQTLYELYLDEFADVDGADQGHRLEAEKYLRSDL